MIQIELLLPRIWSFKRMFKVSNLLLALIDVPGMANRDMLAAGDTANL